MRRVARRLFILCSALSLLLGVAVCVLWGRGYWRYDQFNWNGERHHAALASGDGVIALMFGPQYTGVDAYPPFDWTWRYINYPSPPEADQGFWAQIGFARYRRLGRIGFAYDPNRREVDRGPPQKAYYSSHRVYFPHWAAAALCGILPLMGALRWRRARVRRSIGRCPACGYDLRASPERCPECGALVAASSGSGPEKSPTKRAKPNTRKRT